MSKARILFIPAFFGLPSHFIPLLKLYQNLDHVKYEAAFLLPSPSREQLSSWNLSRFNAQADFYYGGEFLSHFSIRRLKTGQTFSVMSELAAYAEFVPDVIIDDCSLSTALAQQIRNIPRVTIIRTGTFPGHALRLPGHRHSAQAAFDIMKLVREAPFDPPETMDGYFCAEGHLVPGIPPLESVQKQAQSLSFCGPLLLDEIEEQIFQSDALVEFIEKNRKKPIVYVTFGVVSANRAHVMVADCCRHLLERGLALITNIGLPRYLRASFLSNVADRYFYSTALPMHYVCENVALVVHVSSSGVYQYPILHGRPSITVGTRYYDREAIAQNLDALGLSRHLAAPEEEKNFCGMFARAIDDFLEARYPFDASLGLRLRKYRREMRVVSERFDLGALIEQVVADRCGSGSCTP